MDSKDPDAKPLPVDKMMVHHFLYYTRGRVDPGPGGCLGGDFLSGRGEEHPNGRFDAALAARAAGALRRPQRDARRARRPTWTLTAMVMNHYKQAKRFYVRTRIWYTTEPRTQVYPVSIGNCRAPRQRACPTTCRAAASRARRSSTARPGRCRSARASSAAASHHHGGATHQTLSSVDLRRARCSTPRPTTAPPTTRTTRSARSCTSPGRSPTARSGRRRASRSRRARCSSASRMHSNVELHVAAMGFWVLQLVRDDSVTAVRADADGPARGHASRRSTTSAAPFVYDRAVPQLDKPRGRWRPFTGARGRRSATVLQAAAADRARSASGSPGASTAPSRTASPWPTARAGSPRTTSATSAGRTRSRRPCPAPTASPA